MTERDTLRLVARGLRAAVDDLDTTQLAWARLWRAGELHPWTAAAEAVRGHPGDDPWRLHHLAVLHHARAYDLENTPGTAAGDAVAQWATALGYWVRLHRCDAFWRALHAHLVEAGGSPTGVLDTVRRQLPAQLLAVHTALAAQHRVADPDTAAAHLRLVVDSGFPAVDVEAARAGLVPDLDNSVAEAVERVRFGPAYDEIAGWLRVDPTNVVLLRNLLYLVDSWARYLNTQPNWVGPLAGLIDRTERLVDAADEGPAGERARFEWWRGFWRLQNTPAQHAAQTPSELRSRLRSLEVAEGHLRRATELDPGLRLQNYYRADRWLDELRDRQAELRDLLRRMDEGT